MCGLSLGLQENEGAAQAGAVALAPPALQGVCSVSISEIVIHRLISASLSHISGDTLMTKNSLHVLQTENRHQWGSLWAVVSVCLFFSLSCSHVVRAQTESHNTPGNALSLVNKDPEALRKRLLDGLTASNVGSKQVRDQVSQLLRDDKITLAIPQIVQASEGKDQDSVWKFQGLTVVWLFRHRNHANQILSLYNELSPLNQDAMAGLLCVLFPDDLKPEYLPMARAMLIHSAQNAAKNQGASSSTGDNSQLALTFYAGVKAPLACSDILDVEQHYVVTKDQRFNIMAFTAANFGGASEPMVKWYFKNYATSPFEVKTCLSYLHQYEGQVEFKNLVSRKIEALKLCLQDGHENTGEGSH